MVKRRELSSGEKPNTEIEPVEGPEKAEKPPIASPAAKPAEPPKVEAKPDPTTEVDPKPEGRVLQSVPLDIFIATYGARFDQVAGFKSYVRRMKMGPRTIPEWKEAMAAFQNRPV